MSSSWTGLGRTSQRGARARLVSCPRVWEPLPPRAAATRLLVSCVTVGTAGAGSGLGGSGERMWSAIEGSCPGEPGSDRGGKAGLVLEQVKQRSHHLARVGLSIEGELLQEAVLLPC